MKSVSRKKVEGARGLKIVDSPEHIRGTRAGLYF